MADDIAGHSIVDLTYGLESVLTQTVTDWEMWIGEACTDETESVVRGFADPRIHFLNLPRQTGDQAGPNNEGLRLFRGRYIADLNHDDLWLPDHLAVGVDALQQTGADLVWPLIVKRHTDGRYTCDALNDPPTYAPHLVVPASLWVLRREFADEIGPWAPPFGMLRRAVARIVPAKICVIHRDLRLSYCLRAGVLALTPKREFEENAAIYQSIADDPA
jgi:glycosyltransferase involved in cell wall biosynthesis